MFELKYTAPAAADLASLKGDPGRKKRFKAVSAALTKLQKSPRHPGLNTHPWKGESCPHGDTLWECYAENQTAGAYRIFFCYPPNSRGVILIIAITPHP